MGERFRIDGPPRIERPPEESRAPVQLPRDRPVVSTIPDALEIQGPPPLPERFSLKIPQAFIGETNPAKTLLKRTQNQDVQTMLKSMKTPRTSSIDSVPGQSFDLQGNAEQSTRQLRALRDALKGGDGKGTFQITTPQGKETITASKLLALLEGHLQRQQKALAAHEAAKQLVAEKQRLLADAQEAVDTANLSVDMLTGQIEKRPFDAKLKGRESAFINATREQQTAEAKFTLLSNRLNSTSAELAHTQSQLGLLKTKLAQTTSEHNNTWGIRYQKKARLAREMGELREQIAALDKKAGDLAKALMTTRTELNLAEADYLTKTTSGNANSPGMLESLAALQDLRASAQMQHEQLKKRLPTLESQRSKAKAVLSAIASEHEQARTKQKAAFEALKTHAPDVYYKALLGDVLNTGSQLTNEQLTGLRAHFTPSAILNAVDVQSLSPAERMKRLSEVAAQIKFSPDEATQFWAAHMAKTPQDIDAVLKTLSSDAKTKLETFVATNDKPTYCRLLVRSVAKGTPLTEANATLIKKTLSPADVLAQTNVLEYAPDRGIEVVAKGKMPEFALDETARSKQLRQIIDGLKYDKPQQFELLGRYLQHAPGDLGMVLELYSDIAIRDELIDFLKAKFPEELYLAIVVREEGGHELSGGRHRESSEQEEELLKEITANRQKALAAPVTFDIQGVDVSRIRSDANLVKEAPIPNGVNIGDLRQVWSDIAEKAGGDEGWDSEELSAFRYDEKSGDTVSVEDLSANLEFLINASLGQNQDGHGRAEFSASDQKEIKAHLEAITHYLKQVKDPVDQAKFISALAIAAGHCRTGNKTTIADVRRLLHAYVTGEPAKNTVASKIATWLQDMRRGIVLSHVDWNNRESVHGQNYYLNLLGRDVGASDAPPSPIQDDYRDRYSDDDEGRTLLTRAQVKANFESQYTRTKMIDTILKRVNDEMAQDRTLYTKLYDQLRGYSDIGNEGAQKLFDDDGHLTREGAQKLLQKLGYIN